MSHHYLFTSLTFKNHTLVSYSITKLVFFFLVSSPALMKGYILKDLKSLSITLWLYLSTTYSHSSLLQWFWNLFFSYNHHNYTHLKISLEKNLYANIFIFNFFLLVLLTNYFIKYHFSKLTFWQMKYITKMMFFCL